MVERKTGRYERVTTTGEEVAAFVPDRLPPSDPPVEIAGNLEEHLREARRELSALELVGDMVPSVDWFIYAFVRKEAVLSSQIEGTQATLMNLLQYEAESKGAGPSADIEEVCNYLDALSFARREIADAQGLPISIRLLNKTHQHLMRGVRGAMKKPGHVRNSQNWIGGTRPGNATFVPCPPHLLQDELSELELYIHGGNELPALIRIGLIHVQFETLHPYLDGNGRIGRLLITLLFEHWGLLSKPLLYLSTYLKRHRRQYYDRLDAVRAKGDWEGWLVFFLEGVAQVSREAVSTARTLFELVSLDRQRVLNQKSATLMSVRLFELLPDHPVVTTANAIELLGTTPPTAGKAISLLEDAGVLVEVTGKKRDRIFHYQRYLDRLREGTDEPVS